MSDIVRCIHASSRQKTPQFTVMTMAIRGRNERESSG
jgi:hypothetical protein